ncbi:DUF1345 domain-containing protein [Arachidicoccus soli]|uniref:DUF1345 domain-containing protein n=1 Tax=Arachidicoccus soli TaxID=2341117 RepID=A0A386HMS3_9BACT|nr:DUF1345 domain-containing protein [Arachidicoccus soli]AYD47095.1 DUF1345 domain-containing protein [Arachidicoccus soli]
MPENKKSFVNKLSALQKLVISIFSGVLAYFLFPMKPLLHLVFSWDIVCICLLVLTWITFFTTPIQQIRLQAQKQDDSRIIIFILILIATSFSMFSVVEMIVGSSTENRYETFYLSIGIGCMVLSWVLVHTIFAIRYAHLFYAKDLIHNASHIGGLDFPGDTKPDFIDFAYFSFTLGMTFQVSDVEITGKHIRRLSLLHGLFSFAFNAIIIALSVNIISGLISK